MPDRDTKFRLRFQVGLRFAYHQQFTFYSGNRFGVFTEGIDIHPAEELLDHSDGINDIAQ